MSETLYRCGHCRGFYETTFSKCKWCNYDAPLRDAAGQPKVFPNRQTVRAIQVHEFEQLPPEAHKDPMQPPKDRPDLKCSCLHCGPDGHVFEAIEMRWMVNENMWACPCTTCGGRGFQFDIHPADNEWQCVNCGHFYTPEKFTSKYAKCPKCGCTDADGWFDDENEDGEPMTEEEREAEEKRFEAEMDAQDAARGDLVAGRPAAPDAAEPAETAIPLPDVEKPWVDDVRPFDPNRPDDDDEDDARSGKSAMPDDIDHPRHFPRRERDESAGGDDDIPF